MTRALIRTIIVALATAAFAAPSALAQPPDTAHSIATALAASQQQQDLRHLRAGGDIAQRPLPGPPTWPVDPQPISPAPAVHVSDTGSDLGWTTIGLGIAGGLLALGGVVAIALHSRRIGRTRIAA